MLVQVEGMISVADLRKRVIATKGGYWSDGWCTLTLPNYV